MPVIKKDQSASRFVGRVLGYREGDGPSLLFFIIQGVLIQAGIAAGLNGADALFLNQMGSGALPGLYMVMPLFMVFFIPLITALMSKFSIRLFVEMVLLYLAASGFLIWLFLGRGGEIPFWFYAGLKLHGYMWMVSIYSIYWNLVDHYYTALEARRLNPILSGALSAGSMVGGSLSSYFATASGVTSLYFIWGVLAVLAYVIQKAFGGRFRQIYFRETASEEGESTAGGILRYALGTRYGSLLSFSMLVLIFMTTMGEYFYLDIFSKNFDSADSLASFLGSLFFQANLLNLLVNLFLYRGLLRTPGLATLIPMQSFLYLVAFLWLYLNYGMNPAIFVFFIYQGIQLSIDLNNWNFLYNPVPEKIKHGFRSFVEGISDPFGTSMAGLILLFVVRAGDTDAPVLLAFFASIPALVLSIALRSSYAGEMIAKLRKSWIDLSSGDMDIVARRARMLNPVYEGGAEQKVQVSEDDLKRAIATSTSEGMILHFARILARTRPAAVFAIVRRGILHSDEKTQRMYRASLRFLIQQAGAGVMGRIRAWAERDTDRIGWHIREELALSGLYPAELCRKWLSSNEPALVSAGLAGLLSSGGNPEIRALVWQKFNQLYKSDERTQALWLAGEMRKGGEDFLPLLLEELSSEKLEERITALHSILHLATEDSHGLGNAVFKHLRNSEGQERDLCMDILIRTKDISILEGLLLESGNFGPSLQRKTFLFIRTCGLKTIPVLVSILQRWDFPLEARAICARAIGLLSPAHLEAVYLEIAEKEIPGTFRLLLGSRILERDSKEPGPGLELWKRHYEDLYHRSLRFLIQLLSSTGRISGAAQVQAALKSEDERARAYAMESLQAALPASIYRKIVPFVERSSTTEKVEYFIHRYPDHARDQRAILISEFTEEERLESIWSETDAPGLPEMDWAGVIVKCPKFDHLPVRIILAYIDRFTFFGPGESVVPPEDQNIITFLETDGGLFEEATPGLTRRVLSGVEPGRLPELSGRRGFYVPADVLNECGMRYPDFFLSLLLSPSLAEAQS